VARALRAVLNAFWLGVLSDDGLRALDEHYYARTDLYRRDDWNERGLFDWEERLVGEHFEGGSKIVVPAAGGGREVLALVEAGFDAVGYEPHPGLAAYGQEFLAIRGHQDRIRQGQRDEFPVLDAGSVDAVLVGWGAYSLIHGRDRRVAFLAGARHALSAGGPLLLSFFERPGSRRELEWTAAAANLIRRLLGRRLLEPGDTLAPNLVHIFSRDQLESELTAAGFELVAYELVQTIEDGTRYASAVARAA
jgi:SAM-dependent methyltransferase